MTVAVSYTCDHFSPADCPAELKIVLTGDQVYGGIRVRDLSARAAREGWVVRMPRQGVVAMAYCPVHRRREPRE